MNLIIILINLLDLDMKIELLQITAALAALASANSNADDDLGIFGDSDQWISGIVDIDNRSDIFYWLFDSRQETKDTDPLIMWLSGGPGCSSELALFAENGPYKVDADENVTSNAYSWNEKGNLLFVDQPIGTGYSHAGVGKAARSEQDIAEDMMTFFRGFLE